MISIGNIDIFFVYYVLFKKHNFDQDTNLDFQSRQRACLPSNSQIRTHISKVANVTKSQRADVTLKRLKYVFDVKMESQTVPQVRKPVRICLLFSFFHESIWHSLSFVSLSRVCTIAAAVWQNDGPSASFVRSR